MIIPIAVNSVTIMFQAGTTDTSPKAAGRGRYLLFAIFLIALLACANVRAQETATLDSWHVEDAPLRFFIEKDHARSLIPDVSLLDIAPDKKSEAVKKWIDKNRWVDKRRINGELYLSFLPTFGSRPIIYNLHKDFARFVARAGIIDGADPNASVSFEVYADKRLISRAGPLTAARPLAEINTVIPARSKQIKLVPKAPDNKHLRWARWLDPGFTLRGKYPKVSFARIYIAGYNPEDFVPEVIATSTGSRVNSRILSVRRGEPMDILFDSAEGNPSYLIYLVPRNRHKQSSPSWEPQAGLVLETKWTKRSFRSSDRLPEFREVFNSTAGPVGRSLVETIHHAFPIHRMPEYDTTARSVQGGYGLYYYQGFFEVNKKGTYTFATISRWDSYVAVDGKLVVAWPGKHEMQAGVRGEKQGTVSLKPGIHKLEYFNYGQWGRMYTIAAWKKPNEKLRVMTRSDFVPVGSYKVTSANLSEPGKAYAAFEWSPVDDFRLEQSGSALVAMRFEAIRPDPLTRYSYRWTFDDGTTATGEIVDHVFLRPALRKVKLEVSLEAKALAQAVHDVYVHPAWEKCLRDLSNIDFFDRVIQQRNLDKVPVQDAVNLFTLADKANRPDWKKRATAALSASLDRLSQQSDSTDFCFEFGQYLQSMELKQYDKALELFRRLQENASLGASVRRKAMIHQAEVLVKYFGKNQEALDLLNQLPMEKLPPNDLIRRATIAKAEATLGLGRAKEAIELVQRLSASSDPADKVNQELKHAGLTRHARILAENRDDPAQLDYAKANIETILAEDPAKAFTPSVNLIRLDIYLAASEFQAAFHLAERLRNLQLNDYDMADIRARQVIALCGMKDMENAKSVYAQLSRDYPYSPATDQAKQAIIQAFGRQ